MRKYIYAVYKIYFKSKVKKVYIGIDSHFPYRKAQHLNQLRKGKHVNKHLQASFKKYGEANFCFELIELCDDSKVMIQKEIEYIKLFDSFKNGFNMTLGGDGFFGVIRTPEHQKKIADSNRGNKMPESAKQRLRELYPTSALSKYIPQPATEETRKKIGDARRNWCLTKPSPNKGVKYSDETKNQMKERLKTQNIFLAKVSREQVSEIKTYLIKNNSLKDRVYLSEKYGINLSSINCICKGHTWKYVEPLINFKIDFKIEEPKRANKKAKNIFLDKELINRLTIEHKELGYKSLQDYIEFILTNHNK